MTPLCPAVNATPLARKPTTGTSASPMMRVRTETEAIDWANDWSMHAFPGQQAASMTNGSAPIGAGRGAAIWGRVHEMVKQVANHNSRIIRVKMDTDGARSVCQAGLVQDRMNDGRPARIDRASDHQVSAAADVAEAILSAAIAAVRKRLDGAAERRSGQRALHGLAWLATYATAIRALADYAGRLQVAGDPRAACARPMSLRLRSGSRSISPRSSAAFP